MNFYGIKNIKTLLKLAAKIIDYVPRKEWDISQETYMDITNQKGSEVLKERVSEILNMAYADMYFWSTQDASIETITSLSSTIKKIQEGLPNVLENLYWPKFIAKNTYTYKQIKDMLSGVEPDPNIDIDTLSDEELEQYMQSEEFLTKKTLAHTVNIAKFYFGPYELKYETSYGFIIGIKTVKNCLAIGDQIFLPVNELEDGWEYEPILLTKERAELKMSPQEKVIPMEKYKKEGYVEDKEDEEDEENDETPWLEGSEYERI